MFVNETHRLDAASWHPSKHFGLRPVYAEPELIVVHCISLPEGEFGTGAPHRLFVGELECAAHPSFCDLRGVEVAPHLLIDRQGSINQYVAFNHRAWHAGVSSWRGRPNCNDFSVGIELEGCIATSYTAEQYRSLSAVIAALIERYQRLSLDAVVGHQQVAPGRKQDPGPFFDWPGLLSGVHRLDQRRLL